MVTENSVRDERIYWYSPCKGIDAGLARSQDFILEEAGEGKASMSKCSWVGTGEKKFQ